jgi:hypothetical protein
MFIKKLVEVVCISFVLFCVANAQTDPKFIPDSNEYQAFIYGDYDPKKMSVLVFKDPFCPYCIRAIDKLDKLNAYNVFIFWAPILGANSQARVSSFFTCSKLADSHLLDAVKNKMAPNCGGAINPTLMQKNSDVVENYQINAVPSYFLQGQATSLQALVALKPNNPNINGVRLDWSRYALMQKNARDSASNLVLLIPPDKNHLVDTLLSKYKPQYVFVSPQFVAQQPNWLDCKTQAGNCMSQRLAQYQKQYLEFELLVGYSYDNSSPRVIDFNGVITTL